MKRTAKIAIAAGAGGLLLVGGTAAVTAAIVDGPDQRPIQARMAGGTGYGYGSGGMGMNGRVTAGDQTRGNMNGNMGNGRGMNGNTAGNMGNGRGMGAQNGAGQGMALTITAPSGTLTSEQKTALAGMAEEEKLAHDLYTAFAARYDNPVFDRIAAAETRHLEAVRTLLGRYQVSDPTKDKAAGAFANATIQATYNKLLAQGQVNEQGALKAGKTVEEVDIAALGKAGSGVTAPDVKQVYDHLLAGSKMHLAAFERWID